MPQASDELRAEWPGYDAEAIAYLESRGYKLERDWTWTHPTIKTHEAMEQREWSALLYLVHEWDFGGLQPECGPSPVRRVGGERGSNKDNE